MLTSRATQGYCYQTPSRPTMSLASTSALSAVRTLRSRLPPSLPSLRLASTSSYSPRTDDAQPPSRPPRPAPPPFFTGRPRFSAELALLDSLLTQTQDTLRQAHIYPLPTTLPAPAAPAAVRWKQPDDTIGMFGGRIRNANQKQLTELLNELNRMRYLAQLGGRAELASRIEVALEKYLDESAVRKVSTKEEATVDEFGRAHGVGRRKESSARVWIIPSLGASAILDAPTDSTTDATPIIPTSEILVNHLPLPVHFARPHDRQVILRPLRVTGLMGAYNVFALVQGGGTTGQSGAIALGLARALDVMRDDVHEVLLAGTSTGMQDQGVR